MPFKSRVVELLIELRSSGALVGVALPDVQSFFPLSLT